MGCEAFISVCIKEDTGAVELISSRSLGEWEASAIRSQQKCDCRKTIVSVVLFSICIFKIIIKYLSWFSLAGCHVPTKATLSLPLLSWTEEKKYDKRLVGQEKDGERSLSSYHWWSKQTQLGEICLIYRQSNQSRLMGNKTRS